MNPSKSTLLCIAAATILLAPVPARGATSEWSANPQVRVRLISPFQVAPRSGELIFGLHFRLIPGWHIYWKNSGDAGFPPAVTLQPEKILGKPEILWPTPHRYDLPGGLVAFGYEDEVVYPVRVEMQAGAPAAPQAPQEGQAATEGGTESPAGGEVLSIKADLDYVVCEVECIPYRAELVLEQPLGDPPALDREIAPLLQTWLDHLPRTVAEVPGVTLNAVLDASRPEQPDLEIRLRGVTAEAGKTDFFLEPHEALEAGRPRMKVLPDAVIFHVPIKPRDVGKPFPEKVLLGWTVSNLSRKGESFGLEMKREVGVWTGQGDKPGEAPAAAAGRLPRLLLWALLGGLLLNLTPAVLALLAGERLALRQSLAGVRERAAAAATGVVGGSWGIAAMILVSRRGGFQAGWGAQAQEPALAVLLAIASSLLAFNLWGLIGIPLARPESSTGTGRHLLAGLFTVPLALAWPLPMLEEPLRYAFARGPATVCAVIVAVGFGLALPYLILALAPAVVRLVPATPSWLPRLREGLGFLAAAGVFWILHLLSRQVSQEGLAWIELCLLCMALLAWLRAREGSGTVLRLALALGLAACASGALWLAEFNRLVPRPAVSPTTLEAGSLQEPIPQPTSGG
jgi:suppressor for copper-sensitivity B